MQQTISISSRPQDAYRRQDVLTANPVDLIVMLYDALKKNIVMGRRGIVKSDPGYTHKHLMKAQEILSELINSLDMTYEISEELLAIYDFSIRTLAQVNLTKDTEKDTVTLDALVEITDTLRSAWSEISVSNKGSLSMVEARA